MRQVENTQKKPAITIAKAITIILMVTAHAGCPNIGDSFISWFHMPLFFFCSGLCFKEKYITDTWGYLRRKIKGIYWPYVKWSLLLLAIHNLLFDIFFYHPEIGNNSVYSLNDSVDHVIKILTRMQGHDSLLGGFWFLKSLFFSSIVCYFSIKYISKMWLMLGVYTALCLVCMYTGEITYFHLGDRDFMACVFFMLGYMCKQVDFMRPIIYAAIISVVLLIVSTLMSASMVTLNFYNLIPFMLLATAGIYMIMNVSEHIATLKGKTTEILLFIGDFTLDILVWHMIFFKLTSLVVIGLTDLPIEHLAHVPVIPDDPEISGRITTVFWPLYLVAGLGGPLTIAAIKRKRLFKPAK